MVKVSSWAAAALAYGVIPAHCAAVTVPQDSLTLDGNSETKPFRFDIPEGDLSELQDYISLGKRQETLPTILYRGAAISPEALKAAGGFFPPALGEPLINSTYSLQSHHRGVTRTAYISTSRSVGLALSFSVKRKGEGWLYKVHPSPNMIDLNDSGFELDVLEEEEFSALGGIPYDQIEAWFPVAKADFKEDTNAYIKSFHDFEVFSAEYPAKKWTVNPDYNHKKYDALAASPGQPQLAGDPTNLAKYSNKTLEEYAIEFMEKNGAAIGWAGKFPLNFLNTPASPSKPAAPAPAQTPSTANPNLGELRDKLCATGPDGKGKHGLDKANCYTQVSKCTSESLKSPDANWDTVVKCMDTKFLPAAKPAAPAPAQTPSTANPNLGELRDKLCATGPDGKGKHGLDKARCYTQVSQCSFEALKSPDANWDTVVKCMDTKFLPAAH